MHTSKRMHFIEDGRSLPAGSTTRALHTSKRMHFIEEAAATAAPARMMATCIRQNVCTSLRRPRRLVPDRQSHLHTSKRMHFIEDGISRVGGCRSPCLHTSKRMHFIEDDLPYGRAIESTCLHTSKRMHFIEERAKSRNCLTACSCIRQNVCTSLRNALGIQNHAQTMLAYVKTYALH